MPFYIISITAPLLGTLPYKNKNIFFGLYDIMDNPLWAYIISPPQKKYLLFVRDMQLKREIEKQRILIVFCYKDNL